MLKKIFLISTFLLVLISWNTDVTASGYLTSLQTSDVKTTKIFTHEDGGVTLFLSGSLINPDNCDTTERVHFKADLPGRHNLTSAAMAAFLTGKRIGLWSSGCEEIPFWGQGIQTPIITNLWVFN